MRMTQCIWTDKILARYMTIRILRLYNKNNNYDRNDASYMKCCYIWENCCQDHIKVKRYFLTVALKWLADREHLESSGKESHILGPFMHIFFTQIELDTEYHIYLFLVLCQWRLHILIIIIIIINKRSAKPTSVIQRRVYKY